jgi:hypothetical protein
MQAERDLQGALALMATSHWRRARRRQAADPAILSLVASAARTARSALRQGPNQAAATLVQAVGCDSLPPLTLLAFQVLRACGY